MSKITQLTEVTNPSSGDDLVEIVIDTGTTPLSRKMKFLNLLKRVFLGDGTQLTITTIADGEFLKRSGTNITGAAAGGGGLGDFVGPASSVDNTVVRFDGTTGKLGQGSTVVIDDIGALTLPEMTAPATPASGKVAVYAKADGLLYSKDDAGVESVVSGGAGTTVNATNNVIPYRSSSIAFADSKLSNDSGNGGQTLSSSWLVLSDGLNKGIYFGAFQDTGGLLGGSKGYVKVLGLNTDPGTLLSNFATMPAPGGTPQPWCSTGMNYRQILGSNTTIGNPGNHGGDGAAPSGYRFVLMLVQDATGGRTITWSSDYKFSGGTAPTMTSAANAVDIYEFICFDDIAYCIGIHQDVK